MREREILRMLVRILIFIIGDGEVVDVGRGTCWRVGEGV